MVRVNFLSKITGSSILILGLLLSLSAAFFSGCNQDDSNVDELMRLQEEAFKKQLGEDTVAIKKYLADNTITNAKSTKTGLFYVVQDPGVGVKPQQGQYPSVHYTLKNLAGEVLDTSVGKQPLKFQLGGRGIIFGFQEGVSLMQVGGKSRFFLPSGLAYGPDGSGPKIGPNTILIFDIELLQVTAQ